MSGEQDVQVISTEGKDGEKDVQVISTEGKDGNEHNPRRLPRRQIQRQMQLEGRPLLVPEL